MGGRLASDGGVAPDRVRLALDDVAAHLREHLLGHRVAIVGCVQGRYLCPPNVLLNEFVGELLCLLTVLAKLTVVAALFVARSFLLDFL